MVVPNENRKLKIIAHKESKNRATSVMNFCKKWKPPDAYKQQFIYFDFYHKFLYCEINKVRLRSSVFIPLKY